MIELREVNYDNFIECIELEVSEEQKQFVAPNMFSLAQAKVNPEWTPLCIYHQVQMVGFTMYGIDSDDDHVWISRFMIDTRFQRQGFAKLALIELIERIKNQYQAKEIYLSTEPENEVAQKLYEQFGFINTGKIIEGEVVFILSL